MNIKQQMNYHAREYRRLKALDAGGGCGSSINEAASVLKQAAAKCGAGNSDGTVKLLSAASEALFGASRALQDAQRQVRAATSLAGEARLGDNAKLAKAASAIKAALAAL